MKAITKILLTTIICSNSLFAQGPPPRDGEQLRTLKVGFLTKELSLTQQEAQKFWPVYNAHEEKLKNNREAQRSEMRKGMEVDGGAEEALKELIALKKEETAMHETFIKEMSDLLPASKVLRLMRSEEQFKRRLLQEMGRKRRD